MLHFFKRLFNKASSDKTISIKFELDNGETYEELIKPEEFDERVSYLQKHFHQPKALADIKFVYCLVGNIVGERHNIIEEKEDYRGTKHFSPDTKVYCFPPQWGDGYKNIKVIGRHRNSTRLTSMIISSKHITNWRLKIVFNPYVIKQMTENFGWTDKESDKQRINEMLIWLTKK